MTTGGDPRYFSGFPMMPPPSVEAQLRDARSEVTYLRSIVEAAQKQPAARATVLEVLGDKTVVVIGQACYEVATPKHLKIETGTRVNIDPKTNAVLAIITDPVTTGPIHKVARVLDARTIEVESPAGSFVVAFGGPTPAPGDQILLDPGGGIVLRNLGQPPKPEPKRTRVETGVSWDDIGGLEDVKAQFIEAIESPVKDAKLHARYGKKRTKGALVCGPAGCGKTMLGKACATSLAKMHGQESAETGFIYVKGPELLNHFLGNSEKGVRDLFTRARDHFAEHGYPAIIFLDEGDALLTRRGTGLVDGIERTIVPMFLSEMDGLEDSHAFVLVATNRPDVLDPAVTRDGRLDLKIFVRRPTLKECEAILLRYLRDVPLDGLDPTKAAHLGAGELFDDRRALYMLRTKSGKDQRFTLGKVVSGAMCEALVERAKSLAVRRERESGVEGGITAADLKAGADWLLADQRVLEHPADLELAATALGSDYRSHEKVPA